MSDNIKWAIDHITRTGVVLSDADTRKIAADALRQVQAWRTNYPQYVIKDNQLDKRLAELREESDDNETG